MFTERINQALIVAAELHEGQHRKNPERRIPYITHPVAVAMMLYGAGYDEDVVVAGLLHDTVEDTGYTLDRMTAEFGPRVARLVDEVSEKDKSLPWAERKAAYIKRLAGSPVEAIAISCADKTHNIKSLLGSLASGGDIWGKLKHDKAEQVARFERLLEVYKGRVQAGLLDEFEAELEKLKSAAA